MGKKVRINLHRIIEEHNISMRELGRRADIRPSALNDLANYKRQNIHIEHIEKIVEALDITDMNKIFSIVETDDDEHE